MTYLSSPVYALGGQKSSLEASESEGRLVSTASALAVAGFRWHHLAAAGETAYDLAVAAVSELAQRGRLEGTDVIVHSTCIPENAGSPDRSAFDATRDVKHLMDYPASRLQAEFGLANATVTGVGQQACTGLLGAIRLARALVIAEPDRHAKALCLTADRFPSGALYEQAYNPISDGAAACLITADPPPDRASLRILGCHQLTNGALVRATDDETVGSYFSWTHRLVAEQLARTGLALGDIEWVVPQNTNPAAWRILSRLLRVDFERVWFPTLPDVAHMISGDNIANLADLLASGVTAPGDRVLLVMAGYGMNWQSALLEVVA